MNAEYLERCDCGRDYCQFTDCSGDSCISYSIEDLRSIHDKTGELIEQYEKELANGSK